LVSWRFGAVAVSLAAAVSIAAAQTGPLPSRAVVPGPVSSTTGLRLIVDADNSQPKLRVVLPDAAESDRSIEVIFPEHVSGRRRGRPDVEQLYMYRPGLAARPAWRQRGQSLEYEMELAGSVHLLARATLDDDGVRFRYEFRNRSASAFDMIYAVTDPRLTSRFHDVRLERTYVHHADGFDLLASDTPSRLSLPLAEWLPARYLASFTWPVPTQRVERRGDGITYYNKSRAVDEPFIATLSTDRAWVVASVAREVGNVWSNPELTCQHVDPQRSLAPNGQAVSEIKVLIVRGSLADVHARAVAQRASLK
jgi:hypothetical protein